MKSKAKYYNLVLVLLMVVFASCQDQLTNLNVNPNGVDPSTVNPNLLVTTFITATASPIFKPVQWKFSRCNAIHSARRLEFRYKQF